MFKKLFESIKKIVQEEYKFIIFLVFLYLVISFPVNYFITIGGGISDIASRIKVTDEYKSKGSFNISYVTQLQGTLFTYGLSKIIPTWESESTDNYKYNEDESVSDINFRSDLDLKTSNGVATYWAYTLASKKVEEISSKLYVISTFPEFETELRVQDEILSIDNHSYDTTEEYVKYLQNRTVNDLVKVKVLRNGREEVIDVSLHEDGNRLVLGVALQIVKEYKTDPKVKINFKANESGPSGGLITTLEIYNRLTEKDLTKGYKIAGTGTIEGDGSIGEIGGIEHKLLGAVSEDADIFLAPAGRNYKSAVKFSKKHKLDIKIIEVKNIQDAITKLEGLK